MAVARDVATTKAEDLERFFEELRMDVAPGRERGSADGRKPLSRGLAGASGNRDPGLPALA